MPVRLSVPDTSILDAHIPTLEITDQTCTIHILSTHPDSSYYFAAVLFTKLLPHHKRISAPDTSVLDSPSLPLEITEQIIDFVAGLKLKKLRATLAACSLVCRAWNHRSRHHFFQSCRLLVHLNNTLLFGELLRSPSCTILPHLETLTLRNNGESYFHEIQDALKLLANLKSLRLCGMNWDAHGSPPPREFLSSLTNVTDLEIDCKALGDFDYMVETFCAIPSVTRLAIRRVRKPKMFHSWRCTPPAAFVPRAPLLAIPPQLSSLLLDTPAIVPIVHWLNGTGLQCLTTLEISLPPIEDAEHLLPLQLFVQSLNVSLEHFTLSASSDKDCELSQGDFQRTFEFSAFKNLRTCHFKNLFPECDYTLGPLNGAIPSIPSGAYRFFRVFPWDRLDQCLSEKHRLQSVILEGPHYRLDTQAIRKAFSRVGSMGVLELRLHSEYDFDWW
ncbi:hypothetical protein B0H19DRAFT_1094971 [Mycena capillaripes]|nr:hypothetical protein B0H19DRAFT_1094971 [Mycena capillaripes]